MTLPNLFSPIKLGKIEILNRTALAPMGIGMSSLDEPFTPQTVRYFEERAIGEIGLIITPFTPVHSTLSTIPVAGISEDRFIPYHKRFVDCIHQYDTKHNNSIVQWPARYRICQIEWQSGYRQKGIENAHPGNNGHYHSC